MNRLSIQCNHPDEDCITQAQDTLGAFDVYCIYSIRGMLIEIVYTIPEMLHLNHKQTLHRVRRDLPFLLDHNSFRRRISRARSFFKVSLIHGHSMCRASYMVRIHVILAHDLHSGERVKVVELAEVAIARSVA